MYLIEVRVASAITFAAGRPDHIVAARTLVGTVAGVPVFEAAIGGEGPLRVWLSASAHRRALAALELGGEEQVLVAANRTTMIAVPRGVERDRARLSALCSLVDLLPGKRSTSSPSGGSLPPALRPLAALLRRWAIDDDEERTLAIEQATDADLAHLWTTVEPRVATIDEVLDRGEPADASLASLAQAALEAHHELERRRSPRNGEHRARG